MGVTESVGEADGVSDVVDESEARGELDEDTDLVIPEGDAEVDGDGDRDGVNDDVCDVDDERDASVEAVGETDTEGLRDMPALRVTVTLTDVVTDGVDDTVLVASAVAVTLMEPVPDGDRVVTGDSELVTETDGERVGMFVVESIGEAEGDDDALTERVDFVLSLADAVIVATPVVVPLNVAEGDDVGVKDEKGVKEFCAVSEPVGDALSIVEAVAEIVPVTELLCDAVVVSELTLLADFTADRVSVADAEIDAVELDVKLAMVDTVLTGDAEFDADTETDEVTVGVSECVAELECVCVLVAVPHEVDEALAVL